MSKWKLILGATIYVLVIAGLGIFLPHYGDAQVRIDLDTVNQEPPLDARDRAALTLLKLGADRWAMACAYKMGEMNNTPEEMMNTCAVDWQLEGTPVNQK